jgi:dihydrofolate reductase
MVSSLIPKRVSEPRWKETTPVDVHDWKFDAKTDADAKIWGGANIIRQYLNAGLLEESRFTSSRSCSVEGYACSRI